MRLTQVKANLTTKDASNNTVVDVKYNSSDPTSASTILDTSTYCTITMDEYIGDTSSFTGSASHYDLAADSFIVIDIESSTTLSDQKGLKVWLLGYWA